MSMTKRRFTCGSRLISVRTRILELDHEQVGAEDAAFFIEKLQSVFTGYPTPLSESKVAKLSGVPSSVVHQIIKNPNELPNRQADRSGLQGTASQSVSISDILKIVNGLLTDLNYNEDGDLPSTKLEYPLPKDYETALNLQRLSEAISSNGQTIRLITADLISQIDSFQDHLRTKNDIDPDFRDTMHAFFQEHRSNLVKLALSIPRDHPTNLENVEETATYLSRYLQHVKSFAIEHVSAENLAKITIPSGIVLLSGAIGAAFGQPIIGVGFGAWLTGKLSPDKLATKILERDDQSDK